MICKASACVQYDFQVIDQLKQIQSKVLIQNAFRPERKASLKFELKTAKVHR